MRMTRILLCILISTLTFCVSAQEASLELADFVAKGTFSPKNPGKIQAMQDGLHYTRLEAGGTKIIKYSFASPTAIEVVAEIPKLKGSAITNIQDYVLSDDETKILAYTNRQNLYRRSFSADYYVIDIARKEIEPLSNKGPQQAATFAPNGYSVAFVRNNNIYIKNLRFQTEAAITTDGAKDTLINGVPDWVYEEEFQFNKAFEWSPNSEEIAYLKFDEAAVRQWQLQSYKASFPENMDYELYPGEYSYKYPKAGTANSKVSVHVFNIRQRTTKKMDVKGDDVYIPRITWTKSPGELAGIVLNRRQDQLELMLANSSSGVTRSILTDRNSRYIADAVLDNINFLSDGKHYVYMTELDGYMHLHLYSLNTGKVRQLTKGSWDVTAYYGFDEASKLFYFQAAAKSPLQREVYSIKMDGSGMTALAADKGTNDVLFSKDFSYYLSEYSSATKPPVYSIYNKKGKLQYLLEDNAELNKKLSNFKLPAKEFFSFKTEDGVELNAWMIKPEGFDANRKYPVLMMQYSGPESQEVLDKWEIGWEQFLAGKGYLVVCVDGRGTGARGEEFRKQTYMNLGKMESDDQIAAARYLGTLNYVDASRIAIWGWSYGGYISALSMSKSKLFKAGISVAPITHWKYYDTAFTERFMRMPKENPKGYSSSSPIDLADNLSGRLLLIHGTMDDNVHIQNSYEYADKLIQAGKQFDMFIFPNRDHSIRGGNARMHLYQMKFDFLEKNLK
ncbi:MAG: S9 family peptidase [Bacteroidales bacterium]|nr:S9 family peptidase [Bacteroidales bacterium]